MKDASHHLRQIQKKVLQENRKQSLREDLTSNAQNMKSNNEMEIEASTNQQIPVEDIDTKFDRAHRAARVLPFYRVGFTR